MPELQSDPDDGGDGAEGGDSGVVRGDPADQWFRADAIGYPSLAAYYRAHGMVPLHEQGRGSLSRHEITNWDWEGDYGD